MNKKNVLLFIAGAFLSLIIILVLFFASSISAVVKGSDGSFYRANIYSIFGGTCFCSREKKTYKNRKGAVNSKGPFSFSAVDTDTIERIYFITEDDDDKEEESVSSVPEKYLGRYAVNASGHRGTLVLYAGKYGAGGTVRFPAWANGKKERLKKVRIKNGKISFVRSAKTQKAIRRLGVTSYFRQKYHGTYSKGGKVIKGQYRSSGDSFIWEAEKIK